MQLHSFERRSSLPIFGKYLVGNVSPTLAERKDVIYVCMKNI